MNRQMYRALWDRIQTSLWFLPLLMIACAVLIAPLAKNWDRHAQTVGSVWTGLYVASPDAARDVLTTLLTAMMTMASLIFSITMVVLTLAASQFGPRLIRNFMSSRRTQLVLGTFVMTIVYCLLVLILTGDTEGQDLMAWPSVSIAASLVFLSVALLPVFQHGLARSIMSETVIRRVGAELDNLVGLLRPLEELPDLHPERQLPPGFHDQAVRFGPVLAGYVRSIGHDRLVAAAAKAGCVIGLQFRAGDFVTKDSDGIAVFPATACNEALLREVRQAIMIGADRTPVQDVAFSIRHLVEIAVRALSPSLNDPYTAIAAVDQLSASLALLMRRALPPGAYRDTEGAVRVVCPMATHASLIAGAFDQIRQNGAGKTSVAIHLLEALSRIVPHARLELQIDTLVLQAEMILADAERQIGNQTDLESVRSREASLRVKAATQLRRLSRHGGRVEGQADIN